MDRPTSEYELFRAEHLSRLQQETDRMGSDPTALFLYHTARDKKLESPLETSAKLIEDTPYSIGQGQGDQEMGNRLELQQQYKILEKGYEEAQQTMIRQAKDIEVLRTELKQSLARQRQLRHAIEEWLFRARKDF